MLCFITALGKLIRIKLHHFLKLAFEFILKHIKKLGIGWIITFILNSVLLHINHIHKVFDKLIFLRFTSITGCIYFFRLFLIITIVVIIPLSRCWRRLRWPLEFWMCSLAHLWIPCLHSIYILLSILSNFKNTIRLFHRWWNIVKSSW